MDLYTTIRKVRQLKIQGAENIAAAAVKGLRDFSSKSKTKNRKLLLKQLRKTAGLLEATRPTEPCTRNSLKFVLSGLEKQKTAAQVKRTLNKNADLALNHFAEAEKRIANLGARLIKNKAIVFTHCRSSTVIGVLKRAKQKGKHFKVYDTETRPTLEGRTTSKQLAKAGIPVTLFIDSAARLAIKQADLMLIGADAVTAKGVVINKVGSGMFAEIAHNYRVPVYVCTDSWKFDPKTKAKSEKIECRPKKEVWCAPKGIRVNTLRFEGMKPELIKAIISELGVLPPKVFVKKVSSTP